MNMRGELNPHQGTTLYAFAERSIAADDLLDLQKADVRAIRVIGETTPVYYDLFGYFRFEYPALGYATQKPHLGTSIYHLPERHSMTLSDFPRRFAMLIEYPILGGDKMLEVWEEAERVGLDVHSTVISRGKFDGYIIHIDQQRYDRQLPKPIPNLYR
jgi:hypothetical protein